MSPVLLASTQQSLGVAFVVALLVGWALFLILAVRRSAESAGDEAVTAPNRRPYLDDEALEGPRLEQAQKWALVMLFIIVIGMPIYWLKEPTRQAQAIEGFDKRAAARGFVLFQATTSSLPEGNIGHFGCGGCHGAKGEGGVTSFAVTDEFNRQRPVHWKVPALNTVLLRFTPDEVTTILTYGRANTPMPAWGVLGGGPMNDQQIQDLVAYLKSIQLTPKQAQEANAALGTDGAALFDQFCSRCHTKGWSYGEPEKPGSGAFGPNLTGLSTINQFPNSDKHIDFVTNGSEFAKPYGARGVGTGRMPAFGQMLSAAQIKAIVDYERSL